MLWAAWVGELDPTWRQQVISPGLWNGPKPFGTTPRACVWPWSGKAFHGRNFKVMNCGICTRSCGRTPRAARYRTAIPHADGRCFSRSPALDVTPFAWPTSWRQGSKYGNLTSVRVSQDRFQRARWTNFLYASRLASALGIWPFSDVFMSAETDNLLVATLSAGPVGIGDAVAKINGPNLLRAVRPDGVIVKPDVPLTPIDSSFLGDSQALNAPLVAATYSDFGGLRAYYVLAYTQGENLQASFQLSDLGLNQAAYVYDYFGGSGQVVNPGDVLSETIADGRMYLLVSPVGKSGMAILGDTGHFVSLGKKRVSALADDGTVSLTVAFAKGETWRAIRGWSPTRPAAAAATGSAGHVSYDAATGRFSIPVMPGAGGEAAIRISRPDTAAPPARSAHPRPGRLP